jgi:hypothetical protein
MAHACSNLAHWIGIGSTWILRGEAAAVNAQLTGIIDLQFSMSSLTLAISSAGVNGFCKNAASSSIFSRSSLE